MSRQSISPLPLFFETDAQSLSQNPKNAPQHAPKNATENNVLKNGILNRDHIAQAINKGYITSKDKIDDKQIQPASLDLRLGHRGFRLKASFLPGPKGKVEPKAKSLSLHSFELKDAMMLEANCTYLIELAESLALPKNISAIANPKSSTGRIDVFVRLITDYGHYFDSAQAGYHGKLWLEITPRSFGIIIHPHSLLAQLRLRRGRPAFDNYRLNDLHKRQSLAFVKHDSAQSYKGQAHKGRSWQDEMALNINNGLLLSVDLLGRDGLCGYRAKSYTPMIDIDRVNHYAIDDFWDEMTPPKNGRLILEPDRFYILASREAVRIPPSHSAQMVAFDSQIGEFRAHYAGFFDPGFGFACDGGAHAVLEIRSRETAFFLEDGQTIGRLIFERLLEPLGQTQSHYDQLSSAHYQGQGLALSKHFAVKAQSDATIPNP